MPGRNWIQGRVAISTLIARRSSSSSPAAGNWRTTWSCLSSLSTSLMVRVAPARFLATRRASPMGIPTSGGAIAGSVSTVCSAMPKLPSVLDLDADQLRQLVVAELEHLDAQPPSLVDDGQIGDPVDPVDALHHRVQVGLSHRAAERPALPPGAALERVQELLHLVLHVALHAVGRGARLERDGQLEGD